MAAFALGTMPGLIAIGLAARSASQHRVPRKLRILAGLAIALVGAYGLVVLGMHFAALAGLCEAPALPTPVR
jgi:sulfite exporter TauE/SafE